ncbi:alpha-ketoglutarate-dependent dioxygenase AlkB [Mitsuaria sp. 7]|uniref:alpha-ketoglutarate-dependent dioxygenase AlkB n=1 Tax=Mitsuaria sp. 7 TaxID=1658665 RepID=UPI0007DD7015|nr:alpha-ketoglutarate-dependent dioxygenase AlkB [Mitsuaria sp. 7]ANH68033.1 2OG-Fe(II) oxygenase [Mitsuaria sp. 7]
MDQSSLFDDLDPPADALPEGMAYRSGFLSPDEEGALIALIRSLPLEAAQYKEYTARRRVVSYGGSFDYDTNRLRPAQSLIEELQPLRQRVAEWAGIAPEALVHALVAEYSPGTPLGWHRDVPDFEEIFGVSLGASAMLRFRPYPPNAPNGPKRADVIKVSVEPRSIYALRGPSRWAWQHSVAPVERLRRSITFRTARRDR